MTALYSFVVGGRLIHNRGRFLKERSIGTYAERARGAIYWSSEERKAPSPLDLVRRASGPGILSIRARTCGETFGNRNLNRMPRRLGDRHRRRFRSRIFGIYYSRAFETEEMNDKTLFLAWQDQGPSRAWFPVGRLDASPAHGMKGGQAPVAQWIEHRSSKAMVAGSIPAGCVSIK